MGLNVFRALKNILGIFFLTFRVKMMRAAVRRPGRAAST